MKIAVTGKGGVGKTTLSALLIAAWAQKGHDVIALDADPDANLASALGAAIGEEITPLAEMGDLIAERTGSADNAGGYFKLNPRVDDIPGKFAWRLGPIRLLTLGGVSTGGGGCICPASALLKALLMHLVLGQDDAVIMDMEAGIEHLGRATAGPMDAIILVVDAGSWSVQTARRIRTLAGDIGLTNVMAVANRVGTPEEIERIGNELLDVPLIGHLPFDEKLARPVLRRGADGGLEPTEALTRHAVTIEGMFSELQDRI